MKEKRKYFWDSLNRSDLNIWSTVLSPTNGISVSFRKYKISTCYEWIYSCHNVGLLWTALKEWINAKCVALDQTADALNQSCLQWLLNWVSLKTSQKPRIPPNIYLLHVAKYIIGSDPNNNKLVPQWVSFNNQRK